MASNPYQERRKGIAWSEDEHRLFLLGLDKYGKGDWREHIAKFRRLKNTHAGGKSRVEIPLY
ncbi:hypothetical protein ZOSMA_223G00510, partial [Zostera marina]